MCTYICACVCVRVCVCVFVMHTLCALVYWHSTYICKSLYIICTYICLWIFVFIHVRIYVVLHSLDHLLFGDCDIILPNGDVIFFKRGDKIVVWAMED